MIWPNATDYNAAVQNPQLCFRDDDLRQGQAAGDLFGLPRPHSGNFADVYQIQGGDGQSWAVKCFTRPVPGLQTRYHAISEHLRHAQRAFMVEFHFLEEGICIRGQWHPLVKMRWVEGFRLNEFIREHLNKSSVLDRLAQLWVRLAQELRDAGMAHGDLQHGNVLLAPSSKSGSLALKLIDYDGMFVPALADRPSGEIGHPHYQHPRRPHEDCYDRDMDRFSHLLIYTALRSLRVGGEELWQRYDNQENLLFREEDFLQPSKSRLLHELWQMEDREVRGLVGHLLLASRGPLAAIPTLDELINENDVRPLSDGEEVRINELLDGDARPSRVRKRSTPPPLPSGLGSAPTPRRSAAEIELDAQPPAAAARSLFDVAALTDPLVSMLSHPAWLATVALIALISFLVVNVMVWSSSTHSAIEEADADPPVLVSEEKEKTNPPPLHEIPPPPQVKQERPPPAPKPPVAAAAEPKRQQGEQTPPQEQTSPKRQQGKETLTQKQASPKREQGEQTPPSRQEKVHFRTVDHVELAGTLYHGLKGKNGMTVLMLHDLGSSRSSPGWKRLAETLQAAGHTVLTFDFRGHGDSKKVSPQFWAYSVNRHLPTHEPGLPPQAQPKILEANALPADYMPWLVEDIAAARTYLDLRHDEPDGPVNTFNLVVVGAGRASALGSLWLATEGLRYNASEIGNDIRLKWEEKRSVLQAVWIGMADPLKLRPFGIHGWLEGAHAKPVVPITFIYGEDDIDTSTLLSEPIRKKLGKPFVLPKVRSSAQKLLDTGDQAARAVQQYLVKTLGNLRPQGWVPRQIKTLRSYWKIPTLTHDGREQERWFVAKRPGQAILLPVPFQPLNIPPIKGLPEPASFVPGQTQP